MVKKMKKENMELNRETAMRLWNKTFGKKTKVKDFAGREIVKGAYNDRSSDYGWNVDHILPQSRDGKTADHNLICCHILTNDEKADRFPAFKANESVFEIIKVENHYEIRPKQANTKQEENDEELNLYDSASGIRFFKKLKGIQNKSRLVGTIKIRLSNLNNTAVVDFIEEIFKEESIIFNRDNQFYGNEVEVYITNYNMPLKSDSQKLLDKCILINTYLGSYFLASEYIDGYEIYYRCDSYSKKDLYDYDPKRLSYKYNHIDNNHLFSFASTSCRNELYINDLVYINTEACKKIKYEYNSNDDFKQYDYIYTKLAKNLRKEISK